MGTCASCGAHGLGFSHEDRQQSSIIEIDKQNYQISEHNSPLKVAQVNEIEDENDDATSTEQHRPPEDEARVTNQYQDKELMSENIDVLVEPISITKKVLERLGPFKREADHDLEKTYFEDTYELLNGSYYRGGWRLGQRYGYGAQLLKDGTFYQGFWKDNKCNGRGRIIYAEGDCYDGEWLDDKCIIVGVIVVHGFGTYYHRDGNQYTGEWVNNLQEGQGEETFVDGSKYKGEFKRGLKEGQGRFDWVDGSFYIGEFKNNQIEGQGVHTWPDGIQKYEGTWKANLMDGRGVLICSDGRRYEGQYYQDKKHGEGTIEWRM